MVNFSPMVTDLPNPAPPDTIKAPVLFDVELEALEMFRMFVVLALEVLLWKYAVVLPTLMFAASLVTTTLATSTTTELVPSCTVTLLKAIVELDVPSPAANEPALVDTTTSSKLNLI